MSPIEALQSVYAKGERCRGCEFRISERESERIPGSRTVYWTERGCHILVTQGTAVPFDPLDCPGVDDELRSEE